MIFRDKRVVYTLIAGLLLIGVFVLPASCSRRGKGVVRGTMAPAERGVSGLGRRLSEASLAIRGMGGAVEQNKELSHELVRVQTALNQLRDVEAENIRLRRAFKFNRQSPFTTIPCDIISRNINGWWKSVCVGKGSKDGILEHHAVISPDGFVGKTVEVLKHTSKILLICDPGCRVSAKLKRAPIFGLVRGVGVNVRGHPVAHMDFIDKDVKIRVGDEIVTSGLSGEGGVFPKGVRIGYIVKVWTDPSGLFQHAEIAPSATVNLIDYVFVVLDTKPEAQP